MEWHSIRGTGMQLWSPFEILPISVLIYNADVEVHYDPENEITHSSPNSLTQFVYLTFTNSWSGSENLGWTQKLIVHLVTLERSR